MGKPEVKVINAELIDDLINEAQKSSRKRTNHNFHENMDERVHRFLNVLTRGTYVTPHRHTTPPKCESFIVLRGKLAVFIFDDEGQIKGIHLLDAEKKSNESPQCLGVDIAPGIWHSIVCLSNSAVCFEVKPGPYEPTSDKDWAPWAPREGSEECDAYLKKLEGIALHS